MGTVFGPIVLIVFDSQKSQSCFSIEFALSHSRDPYIFLGIKPCWILWAASVRVGGPNLDPLWNFKTNRGAKKDPDILILLIGTALKRAPRSLETSMLRFRLGRLQDAGSHLCLLPCSGRRSLRRTPILEDHMDQQIGVRKHI